ncbi:hypothetical protein M9H77_28113 [Catharanthus roseus]|uniref:Uncharacterized protein n=1 Tax=Catharanthus roseus TaxID=4058 RepID=A0ACC0AEM2_CATRO|nr:hypothetical protein M9H77_28113 [Catharanthus roseus]
MPSGICYILIDAGKFFYHSALKWFSYFRLQAQNFDCYSGLDDLRDWTNNVQPNFPIYVAKRDFEVMKKTHYYLVDTSVIIPGAAVSELQFNIIHEDPFVVHDLKVISEHSSIRSCIKPSGMLFYLTTLEMGKSNLSKILLFLKGRKG